MVKLVKTKLNLLLGDTDDDWRGRLEQVEWAINSLKSSVTGLTPFEVVLGYQPVLGNTTNRGLEMLQRNRVTERGDANDLVLVEKNMEAQARQKSQVHKHCVDLILNPGDLVLVKTAYLREALRGKAKRASLNKSSWHGLFKVVKEIN